MSLIDQAAKRLEELRRAGAKIADEATASGAPAAPPQAREEHIPTPEALVQGLKARDRQRASAASPSAAVAAAPAATQNAVAGGVSVPPAKSGAPASPAAKVQVVIDLARLKDLGFVNPDEPQSQIADEFRVLKRPILWNALSQSPARVRNGNLVLVTSAVQGEGKTFTAVNLAISMAMEFDNSVLLVDGDVAHPSLPALLGLPESPACSIC